MAHITCMTRPVVTVRLDASERFVIASNYAERMLMAESFSLGQDYSDKLIIMLNGYGVKKDGSESQYRYQRQLSVTDILQGIGEPARELSGMTFTFLQRIVSDAVLRWDALGDFIQAYDHTTGLPDTMLGDKLAVTGRTLRKSN